MEEEEEEGVKPEEGLDDDAYELDGDLAKLAATKIMGERRANYTRDPGPHPGIPGPPYCPI